MNTVSSDAINPANLLSRKSYADSTDDTLISFFPERKIDNLDASKEQITIRDILGMRNGFKLLCIQGDQDHIDELMATPDWVQFALGDITRCRPGSRTRAPGSAFYSNW